MLHKKTHVTVDGAVHTIAKVDEHFEGPGHTHRVHTGCGMTIDVDVGGAKKKARAIERLSHVMAETDPAVRAAHAPHHHKIIKNAEAEAEPLDGEKSRWHVDAKARDCAACEAHEAGEAPVEHPLAHTPATYVEADIATNLTCAKCGSKVYKRRKGDMFACTGQGHEFTGAELMDHAKASFADLLALTKTEPQ